MQNSDLKNVIISAVESADSTLLSMLYAVTKSYQVADNGTVRPVTTTPRAATTTTTVVSPSTTTIRRVAAAEPVVRETVQSIKDDRPRKVVRVYRKPQDTVEVRNQSRKAEATRVVRETTPVTTQRIIRLNEEVTPVAAPRVIRVSAEARTEAQPRVIRSSTSTTTSDSSVSGKSNNGGFISTLMTKTVSKSGLPA